MKGPPVRENARVKPQKAHWNVHTAMTVMDWKIMANADFLRVMPPYKRPIPGTIRNTRQPMITW